MISYKRCFYALSLIFVLLNGQTVKSSDLGELQARKYIGHVIDNLFMPQNHSVAHQNDLHNFSQQLTNDLIRNLGTLPHWYSLSKVYNDNHIYREVLNESLAFIEKCARDLVMNEIQHYYSAPTVDPKTFVNKIVSILIKEIKTKLSKTPTLPQGILTGYCGTALATKIHVLVEKELKKEADRLEKLNAKVKCSTCTSTFNSGTNKKINLSCSHTICLACLKALWSKMGSAIACTKCQAKINISEHASEDWATQSPDYGYDYDYYQY